MPLRAGHRKRWASQHSKEIARDEPRDHCRVVFEKMTRLMTLEFDAVGKIVSLSAEDE